MKKRFTILIAALMLLMSNLPLVGFGQKSSPDVLTISSYADANSWEDGTRYYSATVGSVTFTASSGGSNNGKYWESDESWRLYESDGGTITIEVPSGSTLSKATFTYGKGNNGILKYNSTNYSSGTEVSLSGTSAVFTVSHSSGSSSGKVYITEVSVSYTVSGYSVTYKAGAGTGSDKVVSGIASGTAHYVLDNEGVGNPGFTKAGYTFTHWNTASNGSGTSYYHDDNEEHNHFSVTSNTNLFAMWSANTYDLQTESMSNGSVSFTVGGAAATTAKTDQIVTLVVTPDSGYGLDGLTVTNDDTSEPVEVTDNTFTMPASDITVTATFKEAYNISFSVNGAIKAGLSKVIDKGDAVGDLPTPSAVDIPEGYTFKGWIAATQYYNASDAPTYIETTEKPSGDVTYYAVFASSYVSGTTTATLIESEITGNITNTTCAYGSEKTYTDTSDGITWIAACYTDAASRKWMQLKSDKTAYIKIGAPSIIQSVDVIITSATNSTGGINDITKHTAFSESGYIYLNTSNNTNTHAGSVSGSSVSSNSATITPTGNNSTLYLQVSTGARVWGLTVKYATIGYRDYTTLVTNHGNDTFIAELEAETLYGIHYINGYVLAANAVTNSGKIVVINGGNLDMDGSSLTNTNASNLIIEDGGQLITTSSVAATFKKTMTAPSKTDVYGWELISSPVHDGTGTTIAVGNVTNLTTDTYDMFAYNEAAHTWYNQKAGNPHAFTTLNNGEGYMYRNNAQELSFVGNTNSGDVTRTLSYTAGDLAGFHLVGNPYTHSITVDDNVSLLGDGDVALESGKQLSGYYLLTNGGSEWTSELGKTTNIANKQGFLIQIPAEAKKIKFTEAAAKRNSANTDNIMFAVSNSQFNDVTYALFDEALPLNKIDHRNPEVPMLYVNQDGQDYAIATMSDDTKAFNLNFKAGTIGKYTLSYKAEGDFDYIHVIDRLTGEDVDILLEGEYSFIGAPNDNENRFIVKLGYNAANETSDDIFAYHNGNDVIVNGEGELQVFDVTGRMVATQHVNGVETINLNSNGVYIFRLNEKVQKIIVR